MTANTKIHGRRRDNTKRDARRRRWENRTTKTLDRTIAALLWLGDHLLGLVVVQILLYLVW